MSVTNLKKITEKKFDVNFEKWIIEWKNLKPLCLIRITDEEEIFYNNVIIINIIFYYFIYYWA